MDSEAGRQLLRPGHRGCRARRRHRRPDRRKKVVRCFWPNPPSLRPPIPAPLQKQASGCRWCFDELAWFPRADKEPRLLSIHNLGLVGHIEDIAVAKDQQGKKLGLRLIQALDFIAEKVGCYKTILDCSEANEGFYIKCGFKRAGLEMAHYHQK